MLQKQAVPKKLLELLIELERIPELNSFNLAGGTALALQMGHRKSIDIDLFTTEIFDENSIMEIFISKFKETKILSLSKNSVNCAINGIKVDFIRHNYPYLESYLEEENIRMFSLADIAAMKLNAIAGNGSRIKDFIDVYFLLDKFSLEQMLKFYSKKYSQMEPFFVIKSIVYFDDIDESAWKAIKLLNKADLTFSKIKRKLEKSVSELYL
jgi:hypothetical protein